MSSKENVSGPAEARKPSEELEDDDSLDDRWAYSYDMPIDTILATLRLRPGETPPDWFEPCVFCEGARCYMCDDSGRVHPHRVQWHEDFLMNSVEEDSTGRLRLPRAIETELKQARAGKLRRSDVAGGRYRRAAKR